MQTLPPHAYQKLCVTIGLNTTHLCLDASPSLSLWSLVSIYGMSMVTCSEGGPMPFAMPRVPLAIPNISRSMLYMSHDPSVLLDGLAS